MTGASIAMKAKMPKVKIVVSCLFTTKRFWLSGKDNVFLENYI